MMPIQFQVLLIEDNPADVRLLLEVLDEVSFHPFVVKQTDTLADAIALLKSQSFDVVLLDLSLPDSLGFNTFATLHRQVPALPIVVLTGLDDEDLAAKAMQAGAQDYLVKGQVSGELLARSLRYAIERQHAENSLRQSEERFRVALKNSPISVFNQDPNLRYTWIYNPFLDYSVDQILGKQDVDLFTSETTENLTQLKQQVIATGIGTRSEVLMETQTKTGHYDLTIEPLRTETNEIIGITGAAIDITEMRQLEAQFVRLQRLESIGTLASGIAHDLNNILTPILAVAQLLPLKLHGLDESTTQLLEILETNTKRGADLVKQVLAFTRGVEGKRMILQPKHLIREVEKILRGTFPKSIDLKTDLPKDLWTVCGDSTQLHQVLMNLCVNARDAMPQGGVLKISAENQWIDEEAARLNLEAQVGAYSVISVSDTGSGIPPHVLDRIFEPFFTTKDIGKGTGLGLSTVAGIVRSHGGFITVNSKVGQGTEFKVFLPATQLRESVSIEQPELPTGDRQLILVVDDEAAIREMVKTTLESFNYQVLVAKDGTEAISLYAKHKHEIALVLVDLMMPFIDGLTTIRTLQQINPHVSVIAMSGLASQTMHHETMNVGVHSLLAKPFTVEELLKVMQERIIRVGDRVTSY